MAIVARDFATITSTTLVATVDDVEVSTHPGSTLFVRDLGFTLSAEGTLSFGLKGSYEHFTVRWDVVDLPLFGDVLMPHFYYMGHTPVTQATLGNVLGYSLFPHTEPGTLTITDGDSMHVQITTR